MQSKIQPLNNTMANIIWTSKTELQKNIKLLESPETLDQYFSAIPKSLTSFFDALIMNLEDK
ncbi:5424_t:CDS:2 [Ambispora leptoticha]|uniref:5424_t:CDS:1 n=1 Tax=Ambispora leptoticha TaxID=144679 RepID=A0A9N8WDE6_9GLOM|nr:5424_t:CDS:2 [Ambispora leptoticha]